MIEYVAVSNTAYEQLTYDGTNEDVIASWLGGNIEVVKGPSGKLHVIELGYPNTVRSFDTGQTLLGRVSYGPPPVGGGDPDRYVHLEGALPFGHYMVEKSQVPPADGGTQTVASTA